MKLFLSGETAFDANEPFEELLKLMINKLKKFVDSDEDDETYGSEFKNIGIITMILSPDLERVSERKLIHRKTKDADIRLRINYEKFINSDKETQFYLYLKNIIDAINIVNEMKKEDFKGEKLICDILKSLDISMEKMFYEFDKISN